MDQSVGRTSATSLAFAPIAMNPIFILSPGSLNIWSGYGAQIGQEKTP